MLTLVNDNDTLNPLTSEYEYEYFAVDGCTFTQQHNLQDDNTLHLEMEPFDYQAFLESQNIPHLLPPLSPDSESAQSVKAEGIQDNTAVSNSNINSNSNNPTFDISNHQLSSFHPDTFAMMPFDLQPPQLPSQSYSQQLQQQQQQQQHQFVSNLALRRAQSHNLSTSTSTSRRISSLYSPSSSPRVSSLSSSPRMSPYPIPTPTLPSSLSLYSANPDISIQSYPNTNTRSNTTTATAASAGSIVNPPNTSMATGLPSRSNSAGLRRKPTPWSEEEERTLIDAVLGGIKPAWVEISKSLPGHSADNIRKHWSTIVKRMTRKPRGRQPPEEDADEE